MFTSTLLIAAAGLLGLVSAQNYSTSGPLTVVPNSVPYATRLSWCNAQQNTCRQLCGQTASNACDPNQLTYNCSCESGNTPNITSYQQTLPALMCNQWQADCVAAHPNDLVGQTACLSVVCGNMTTDGTSSSSASGMASSTAASSATSGASTASATAGSGGSGSSGSSASPTASSSSSAASASSSSAAIAMSVAKSYGTGILATGLLAIFGLAL